MFTINELLKATKGKLICGQRSTIGSGISIDSRKIKSKEVFIAIKGDNFDGHDFISEAAQRKASVVIAHSDVSNLLAQKKTAFIRVEDTIKALGDIARYNREKFDIPVIAVTGSNGKTTTKEMLWWVLSGEFNVLKNPGTKNNHIGLPLTLLSLGSSQDMVVLELGTNHFKEISYLAEICEPNIGVITNIGPSHLEHFHNLGGVFKEKFSLISDLRRPRISILNSDDRFLKKEVLRRSKNTISFGFGIKNKSDFSASNIKIRKGKAVFLVNKKYEFTLDTVGYYNIYNALAAISIARLFGMEYTDIASRLSTFSFPQSRLNVIELNKVRFIDDTYNSNPNSLNQALEALGKIDAVGRKIFVMGDMLELGSLKKSFHRQAGRKASKVCDVLITVGSLSRVAAEVAKDCGFDTKNIFSCDSSLQAREILFKEVAPVSDDIVLVKGSRLMKMEEVFKISG